MARLFQRRKKRTNQDLLEAKGQFEAQGLPFPYIPKEMEAGFKRLRPWVFGTGHRGHGLYNISKFSRDALTRPQEDFLLLGQAGHGIQSYAMHYYVARNPLYLFLQIAYGGAYTDNDEAIDAMNTRYALAEQLIKTLPSAARREDLPPQERWIITSTDFYNSSWVKIRGYEPLDDDFQELDESRGVLEQVLDTLEM